MREKGVKVAWRMGRAARRMPWLVIGLIGGAVFSIARVAPHPSPGHVEMDVLTFAGGGLIIGICVDVCLALIRRRP